jgi:hypothetical protein
LVLDVDRASSELDQSPMPTWLEAALAQVIGELVPGDARAATAQSAAIVPAVPPR